MTQLLFDSIQTGDESQVAELLDTHPDWITARTPNGVSAISTAMYQGRPAIAKLFVDRGASLDIFEAAAVGTLDRVCELVRADTELVNACSPDGFPPLGLAAFFGHLDVVEWLIDHGAEVNAQARNPLQVCPLHAAAARNDASIVRVLLTNGADPNRTQQAGFTAMHSAAQNGNAEIVDLLLAHGADPAPVAQDGRVPSGLARERGHHAIAERLEEPTSSAQSA